MRVRLSLDRLPSFNSSTVAIRLEPRVDADLSRFADTHSRACVALRFLQRQSSPADHLGVRRDEERQMQAGYLRAALMEYVGMEDCLPGDLRRLSQRGPALRISDTGSAMLILLRELRHVHVHLGQVQLIHREQPALICARNREIKYMATVLTVPMTDLERLLEPRHAKKFHASELRAAVDWLNEAQNHWGMAEVVQAAINDYGRRIVNAHSAG